MDKYLLVRGVKITDKKDLRIEKKIGNSTETKIEKIEICYFCHKKFDMYKEELSYYKYEKYPMCGYCAEFYGFYSD